MIQSITDPALREILARQVLSRLPDWFGIPEAVEAYCTGVRETPFWAETDGDILRGFIALLETSPAAAEIHVMGVLPEYHRQGVGTALYRALEAEARDRGYSFLHVRTVAPGCYAAYDRTNAFYTAMGFTPLTVLPTVWDEKNPCQIYVKRL